MMYQGLSKEIVRWNEAKVKIGTTVKDFYRMDIKWEYLRDKFPIISSVTLCILTILHSNAAEERVCSMTKKNKNNISFKSGLENNIKFDNDH